MFASDNLSTAEIKTQVLIIAVALKHANIKRSQTYKYLNMRAILFVLSLTILNLIHILIHKFMSYHFALTRDIECEYNFELTSTTSISCSCMCKI